MLVALVGGNRAAKRPELERAGNWRIKLEMKLDTKSTAHDGGQLLILSRHEMLNDFVNLRGHFRREASLSNRLFFVDERATLHQSRGVPARRRGISTGSIAARPRQVNGAQRKGCALCSAVKRAPATVAWWRSSRAAAAARRPRGSCPVRSAPNIRTSRPSPLNESTHEKGSWLGAGSKAIGKKGRCSLINPREQTN